MGIDNGTSYQQQALMHLTQLVSRHSEKRLVPAKAVLDLYDLLVQPEDVTDEARKAITTAVEDILTERRGYIFEEIELLDGFPIGGPSESCSDIKFISQQIPPTNRVKDKLERRMETMSVRTDNNEFIQEHIAKLLLKDAFTHETELSRAVQILKRNREGMIFRHSVDDFLQAYEGYTPLHIRRAGEILLIDEIKDVYSVLSSFIGMDITNLVLRVNPYLRVNKSFYVIRKEVDLESTSILRRLGEIQTLIGEGDFSYDGVAKVLVYGRRMPADNPMFDAVVATVFERREEGTFTREGVDTFNMSSHGYRFSKLTQLFGHNRTLIERGLELLAQYNGELIKPIRIRDEFTGGNVSDVIYLFKCDEEGHIDSGVLKREIGFGKS